jgi:hypothetical protein
MSCIQPVKLRCERCAGHDGRLGDLARLLVGDADHGGVGDRGVGEQHALQFGGGDLVALVLDELLDAVDDSHRALVIDARDVAGVQPAVGIDGARCRLGLA